MLNQHVFLSFVRNDAEPIRKVMRETPRIPLEGQWASFLRSHDEIDLGRLSDRTPGGLCGNGPRASHAGL